MLPREELDADPVAAVYYDYLSEKFNGGKTFEYKWMVWKCLNLYFLTMVTDQSIPSQVSHRLPPIEEIEKVDSLVAWMFKVIGNRR